MGKYGYRFMLYLLLLAAAAAGAPCHAKTDVVTIFLPAEVIRATLQDILPLNIEEPNGYVEGTLILNSISRLEMGENSAVLQGTVVGKNLSVVTQVGSQPLRIKVGDLQLPLTYDLFFRYDQAGKVLYVTPRLRQPVSEPVSDMAGSVMSVLTLFSNREYPVSLDSLKTFTAKVGSQDVTVTMEPVDIRVSNGQMVVRMVPRLSKTN